MDWAVCDGHAGMELKVFAEELVDGEYWNFCPESFLIKRLELCAVHHFR